MSKVELRVDFCSHEAAKYAVEKWHYSERFPVGKIIKFGVWEDSQFTGAVLFARGNSMNLGKRYGLDGIEVCELVRVALTRHVAPVSQVISKCISALKSQNPGLRLIISYADPEQDHHGGIYQAGNWIYDGDSGAEYQFFHEGRWKHRREVTSGAFGRKGGVPNYNQLPKRLTMGKHRYLYPLDRAMRRQIEPLAKPYPKRADVGEIESR